MDIKQRVFPIIRDSCPLERKLGNFFSVAIDFRFANFSIEPLEESTLDRAILVNFFEPVFEEDVLDKLDEECLRPGLPTELADLSRSYPDYPELSKYLQIIALGESWEGRNRYRYVPCILAGPEGLVLSSTLLNGVGWNVNTWFLAFYKRFIPV